MNVSQALLRNRVVVIYRGLAPAQCLHASRVLYEAGLRAYEVTMNSDRPLEAIELLRGKLPDDALVGAGTVLRPEQVGDVARSGASFVISPDIRPEVVAATKERGLASIPGTFTPSEVLLASRAGADIVKVFPIRPVGAGYIRQLRGPIADVPLLASGGVDAELAAECFAAGCEMVGVGIQLLGEGLIESGDWSRLARAAERLHAVTSSAQRDSTGQAA